MLTTPGIFLFGMFVLTDLTDEIHPLVGESGQTSSIPLELENVLDQNNAR